MAVSYTHLDVYKRQTNKPGTKKYKEFIGKASKKINIIFKKVRDHTGVDGNEEADMLAKKAAGIL